MKKSSIGEMELAKALVPLIGQKENIIGVTHCITRLRFILKDEALADTQAIEGLPGVVKVFSSGGQYQVVIGATVPKVYEALMAELNAGGLAETEAPVIVEPEAKTHQISDLFVRRRFRLGLGKLSAFMAECMQPLIPLLVSVGIIRTLAMLLGPTMLGLLGSEDGTYRILTIVGNVGIASLPIFMAWSISNYLKTNSILALFYGALLVHPDLTALLNSGETVRLFGLPVPAATYTSQVVPMVLIMVAMYLVEKLLKKRLSEDAQLIALPILETLIMLPLMLCFVGPLGTILGQFISRGAVALYDVAGPLSVALIGAFFTFICATGMHTAIIATSLTLIQIQGYDSLALVGAGAAAYACFGVYMAYTLFEKDKKQRAVGLGVLITHALGGIAEPGLFSLLFTNGHLMCIQSVAAFFGALYLGIKRVGLYMPGISNFMAALQFSGGGHDNFRNAVIGCGISFVMGFIMTMIHALKGG